MSPLLTGLFDRLIAARAPDLASAPERPEEGARPDSRRQSREPCAERALLEWLDERNERHAEIVWVHDRSAGGLGVRSPYRLEVGWPVLVTFGEEAPAKAMVRCCEADPGEWRAGLKLVDKEKRRHDRSPARGHATVVWQSAGQTQRHTRARILDVSEDGMGLSAEAAIPNQTSVCILHEGWQRYGSVTHGRAQGERYVFGVQFAGPPRPSASPDYVD